MLLWRLCSWTWRRLRSEAEGGDDQLPWYRPSSPSWKLFRVIKHNLPYSFDCWLRAEPPCSFWLVPAWCFYLLDLCWFHAWPVLIWTLSFLVWPVLVRFWFVWSVLAMLWLFSDSVMNVLIDDCKCWYQWYQPSISLVLVWFLVLCDWCCLSDPILVLSLRWFFLIVMMYWFVCVCVPDSELTGTKLEIFKI